MKILIIGDSYEGFGSEIYALNLKKLFENHKCVAKYIYFSGNSDGSEEHSQIKLNKIEKIFGRLFKVPGIDFKLRQIVDRYQPDFIILNNIYLVPFSVISIVGRYKTIRVIHDCRCICHAGLCLNDEMKICRGYKYGDCYKCGKYGRRKFSSTHIMLKCFIQKRLNQAYLKNKIKAIFPSSWLKEYCEPYGIEGYTIHNFIDTVEIPFTPASNRKNYVYIGGLSIYKGTDILLEAFNEFSRNKNVDLFLAGPLDEVTTVLIEDYEKNKKIHYIGIVPHEKVIDFLADKYCLIMPSIIMDNYPTAVMEGIMSGKLIIGSNRGGIPEMISGNGLIFDPEIESDLLDKLNQSQNMDDAEVKNMLFSAYEQMKRNTGEYYYNEIMDVYSGLDKCE